MRINQSISKTSFYSYLHLFTFRWLRQFAYFSFFMSSHRFSKLYRFSATFDDPRVPREYLLAVTSGRIAVIRTKVLVSSSLSINRSNRLARFGYRLRVLALCVCRSTFASTVLYHQWLLVWVPCKVVPHFLPSWIRSYSTRESLKASHDK
jgi:hypothetical protein